MAGIAFAFGLSTISTWSKAEDALAAGNRTLQICPEDRDLRDRLIETLRVADEGDDQAERDRSTQQLPPAQDEQALTESPATIAIER